MRRRPRRTGAGPSLAALALLAGLLAGAGDAGANERSAAGPEVAEIVLENGFRLLFSPRPDRPLVAAGWVVPAGSASERTGATGVAHLVEHLLFNGSEVVGTRDWKRERRMLERWDALYDRWLDLRAGRVVARGPDEVTQVQRRLVTLGEELREVQRKGEYGYHLTEAGVVGVDGMTDRDFSMFVAEVPRSKIELWFWLESDRLLRPVVRDFLSEIQVVHEELRQRVASTPAGLQRAAFDEHFWGEHPYAWPPGGRIEELLALAPRAAREHLDRHYRAENVTAALVGDLEVAEVRRLAEAYFGRLPASRAEDPAGASAATESQAIAKPAERRSNLSLSCACRPLVELRFPTPPFASDEAVRLDVVAGILNGRAGRLHRRLVVEEELAFSAYARHTPLRLAGSFALIAEAREAGDAAALDRLERALERELGRLATEPPAAAELQAVKNRMATDAAREVKSSRGLMTRLLVSHALGDWRRVVTRPRRVEAVTAEQVAATARALLDPQRASVLRLRREGGDDA